MSAIKCCMCDFEKLYYIARQYYLPRNYLVLLTLLSGIGGIHYFEDLV